MIEQEQRRSLGSTAGDGALGEPRTSKPAPPRISVVVPVHNDPFRLKLCLEAIARSSHRDYEVIVADDASTDETSDVAEAHGARVVRLVRNVGSAAARNAAVEQARGPIVLFVDADVLVHRDTLEVAAKALEDPAVDAVFGSYDLDPGEQSLLSQYKNLAHRYYHQTAHPQATTFWTGCGAIRRDVFRDAGGFDATLFGRPSIEDIELGVRLTRAGRRILINRQMQAKHLKRWGLRSIFRSDVFDRAIPWTRLILQMEDVPDDLNLAISQRISAILSAIFVATYAVACWFKPWLALLPFLVYGTIVMCDRYTAERRASAALRWGMGFATLATAIATALYAGWWLAALAAPLALIVLINARFYLFFLRHRGVLFTTAVLPMHVLYYVYSATVFAIGVTMHRFVGRASVARSPAAPSSHPPADVTCNQ